MSDYVLTIRIPVDEKDDIEARNKAKEILSGIQDCINDVGAYIKFQRIYDDREPRGIDLLIGD